MVWLFQYCRDYLIGFLCTILMLCNLFLRQEKRTCYFLTASYTPLCSFTEFLLNKELRSINSKDLWNFKHIHNIMAIQFLSVHIFLKNESNVHFFITLVGHCMSWYVSQYSEGRNSMKTCLINVCITSVL